MFLMMKSSSASCRNPNMNINRDQLPDYYIKAAANLHQPAVRLTPKLTSTSSTTQNPVLPLNYHQHQMVRGTSTSTAQGRSSSSGSFCIDKKSEAAAPLRRSRWTPTPEQVMALKEMYRCGLKTPTAKQIQLVTVQLRNYGRIEGKNVFYWFQNYRARERQKRRRQVMSMYKSTDSKQQQTFTNNTTSGLQDKESAGGLTNQSSLEVEQQISLEVEQQNKWKLPNRTVISDQESSSVLPERMMSMVDCSSMQLVEQMATRRSTSDATLIHRKLLDYRHCYHHDYGRMVLTEPTNYRREEESRETQTLELFPLKSDNLRGAKDTKVPLSRTTSTDNTADLIADDIISFFERFKAAYN
ncbi:hypothetical protein ACLB2K_043600 [Fragaria x ananassa]